LWSHVAYAKELNLRIPLLTDFHPKGEVCRRFDVYRDDIGTAERALVVLDGDGRVFWSHVSPIEVNPGADGVLGALEQLTGKDLEKDLAPAPAETQPRPEPQEQEASR
jgi:peroxiredoxin (alkyl hydroperoxide reductase subunit C)